MRNSETGLTPSGVGTGHKTRLGAVTLALLLGASTAFAAGPTDTPQISVSSLEVKARIASMEQVNVTAEKTIDASVPAASKEVESLLDTLLQQMQADETELDDADPNAR